MDKPYFSIVMPHYHGTIPHDRLVRAVLSIKQQSFQSWELLIYHDGPINDDYLEGYVPELTKDKRIRFEVTNQRAGDWGHSSRDIGIRCSRGTYIIHMNSDNVLYQHSLAILYAYSKWDKKKMVLRYAKEDGTEDCKVFTLNPDCLVFAIKMFGMLNHSNLHGMRRYVEYETDYQLILPGWPPNKYFIDAMQLVAKRDIWIEHGGWRHKHSDSDGDLIQEITRRYGYLVIPDVLGEHW